MLKRIATAQLQLGMYLHAFDGPWLDHPFWRCSFLLHEPSDLARALESGVEHCWIDPSRGADEAPARAIAPRVDANDPGKPAAAASRPLEGRVSLEDELARAARLCGSAAAEVRRMFDDARLGRMIDAQRCLPLVDGVADSLKRHADALIGLTRLKRQDDYSYMHSVAVCALMIGLARRLGLPEADCRDAGVAGLLHDIGKSLMPVDILDKPGRLDDAEFAVIRQHPARGHELLSAGTGLPESALDVCLHHHEKMDGSGYPHGLAGDRISLLARMGAICDVYDAVTSSRPYKHAWSPPEALARMVEWKGHFDPALLRAFIATVGIYPLGSVVRLASGRVAVVVEQNATSPVLPVVKAFFSSKSGLPIEPQRIDLAQRGSTERVVGIEDAAHWNAREVAQLWAAGAVPKGYAEESVKRARVRP